jgi:hypothetical protein
MSSIYSVEEFEKLFLESRRQKGKIAALEDEAKKLKSDLFAEQRARAKSVLNSCNKARHTFCVRYVENPSMEQRNS